MGGQTPQQAPDYTGLNLQTASMTLPIPLAWGKSRGSPNLIYYTDFTAHQHGGLFGKGGAFGKSLTYTYSATIILALCEGPVVTISRTWINDGSVSGFSASGFTFFSGTIPQAPWSYLTSNHPADAFGYQGICYVAAANYNLGESEVIPQQSFEVEGPLYNTGYTGQGDADVALIIQDFLTNPEYGANFDADFIDATTLLSGPNATTTGDSALQTYARAMGWGLSPFIQSQEAALDILSRWFQISNCAPVWAGYILKFVPYGDAPMTANGVTYLPPTNAVFSFTDDDYIQDKDNDPVGLSIADWFDANNSVAVECRDRAYDYNTVPIDWIDSSQADNIIGRRYASTVQAHEICDTAIAFQLASLIGARMVYVRDTFQFKVGPQFSQLEPMDCGYITETILGLVNWPVRIREIEEQDDDSFLLTVEEFPGTTGQPSGATTTGGIRAIPNSLVVPDPVNPPIIFEPDSQLAALLNSGSAAPIIIALVSGGAGGVADPNWGGAVANVSSDGTTYGPVDPTIERPATQGVLTANLATYGGANPDTVHTLSVSLVESAGALVSASSPADAAAGATVCYVDGEFIAFETATLTGPNAYDLTGLYRGLFGSSPGAHASGAAFGRLDSAIFMGSLPAAYIGVALDFKFQSFNIYGNQTQDISTCVAYPYTPTGAGSGGGAGGVPTTPTGLSATGGIEAASEAWNANPAADNVTGYNLYQAPGPGGSFGAAVKVATTLGLNWTVTGLAADTVYTFFLTASNAIGESAPTSGEDATTASTALGVFGVAFACQDISTKPLSTVIGRFAAGVAWTLPATASTPAGYVEGKVASAPTSDTVFALEKDGSSVATVKWASGSTTPTLICAADVAFAEGDYLDLVTPAGLNAMAGAFGLTVMGTR